MVLSEEKWQALWQRVGEAIHDVHTAEPRRLATGFDPNSIRDRLAKIDFSEARDADEVTEIVLEGLRAGMVPTSNPRYYGLFNPGSASMGAVADALVAGFNPQLAAWTHAPFPNEVETHLIRSFGEKFGFPNADGVFCTAGAEANHTALLCALVAKFPRFSEGGVRSLDGNPVLYVSEQAHHSFIKAARFCGLGSDAVRQIPVDDRFAMDVTALKAQIESDRRAGRLPFMVSATAGTTSGGIIDPLEKIAEIARQENLWFHADAAWGGAAVISPELKPALTGIELSDSITFDAHKWLSVPMGAGMFFTRDPDVLAQTCRITTDYMPRDGQGLDVVDPYTHSVQWSRRFTGLKLFMTLAHLGWDGYADVIERQASVGRYLRESLRKQGWDVVNDTPFPIACFRRNGWGEDQLLECASQVVASGEAWISFTRLRADVPVIRACITHYRTAESDIDALLATLDSIARGIASKKNRPHAQQAPTADN